MGLGVDLAEKVPFGDSISASVARRNILKHGRAVHRRRGSGRSRRGPAPALAGRQRVHRRPPRREDGHRGRGRPLRGAGRRAAAHPPRPHPRLGAGRRPRVRRPRPPAARQRQHQADGAGVALLAADAGGRPAPGQGSAPTAAAPRRRARRLRVLRHGALRGQGPHAASCSASCSTNPSSSDLDAGVVIQAYLKDSRDDLAELIAWSSSRAKPIGVRLVKGAYWDSETIVSTAEGWPVPVFEHKDETDANYERCVRLLHDHHGAVRAAFASHNLRSLAYAITYARTKGIADSGLRDPDALRHGGADPRRHPPARSAPCASTRPSATSCPGWRTSSAGCSRTRRTRASCATASPRAASSRS